MSYDVMRRAYRPLADWEKSNMEQVKEKGEQLWNLIDSIGQSREMSIAKTKVEEAIMWATKHITA